jgi:glycosyltransferase involved in cell wall biosynthesis
MRFVLLTGEYPPYHGGVGEYTWNVAQNLQRRGATVQVIVFQEPRGPQERGTYFVGGPLNPASFRRASRIIKRTAQNSVLLVQYVPQMYGLLGMNLAWVLWLCRLQASSVWLMFHEVHFVAARGASWKHHLLALITQNMSKRLANKADRCFVSISAYGGYIEKFTRVGIQPEWLPVPSNVAVEVDQGDVDRLRARLLNGGAHLLVGHFGTYRGTIRALLHRVVAESRLLYPNWKFVFIGRGSREFLSDLETQGVLPRDSAAASGGLGSTETACWIKACDVMVQPYPDGVSTRRTSLMAPLALGKATISNLGHLSDSFWEDSSSIYLAAHPDPRELVAAVSTVLNDCKLRNRLQADAARCYVQRFSLERTIEELETVAPGSRECLANQQLA